MGLSGGGGTDRNLYLMSLQDPENHPGVRVPDMVTFPSSVFQLTLDTVLTPGNTGGTSYGDGVLAILNPILGNSTSGFYPIYTGTNTTALGAYTLGHLAWNQETTLRTLYDSYRPVSAAIYAEYAGNSTTDSGTICMGIIPRDSATIATLVGTFSAAIAQSYTKAIPLRNGAVVTWKPQDNHDLEYKDVQDTSSADHLFPYIFIATSGMSASANNNCNLRLRFIVNFEALPTTDTYAVLNTGKSESNLPQLEQAMNWASQAYNNMSAFVSNVTPFVQPILNQAIPAATRLGQQYLQNSLAGSRGTSLRIAY